MLSAPKRLRYFMQRDGVVLYRVLRIFLRVIAQSLQAHCLAAAQVEREAPHIGAVAFIHRFCSASRSMRVSALRPATAQRWSALLRYCARPPFAMDRLRKEGAALVYRCAKQHSEPAGDKRGAKVDELTLTPLALIDRIAALIPPPRTHRRRYFGVLAPNSPPTEGQA